MVENKPGAGGTIGSDLAAKAPPDGYTLVISHASPLGIAPGIYPKLPYDVVKDFSHVTLIGHTPNVLIVPADSPYKTLADYIAAAKAKPDEIAFGSSGIGSNTHLMGELLSSLAGIKLKHVPYQRLGAVAAGHAGRRHPLDVRPDHHQRAAHQRGQGAPAGDQLGRSASPCIPTRRPSPSRASRKMTTSTWVGVSGPKGMAPEVVARLYDELQKAYKAPDVVGALQGRRAAARGQADDARPNTPGSSATSPRSGPRSASTPASRSSSADAGHSRTATAFEPRCAVDEPAISRSASSRS